jgi:3,4-dihydroxy 2-butanone 4-phosphate synthase/3,4-dihydroxy 2-butanone 4-phosphate synthase/GTP cyclohydrolase II
VRERPGHTEAAVDLCRLAGLEPVGVIAEVVYDDGEMMRLDGLRVFAAEHGCPLISIEDLVAYLGTNDHVSSQDNSPEASPAGEGERR